MIRTLGKLALFSLIILCLVGLLIFFMTGLSRCCSADDEANGKTRKGIGVTTELPVEDRMDIDEAYRSTERYLVDLISPTYQELGLEPLSTTEPHDEFTLRLWTNLGGRGDPKLLIVRLGGSEDQAVFSDIKRSDPRDLSRVSLTDPKSGWYEFEYALRERLSTPRALSRDAYFYLDRDEPIILMANGDHRLEPALRI